jgi:RND family efflux transporter MFP subunit
MRGGGKGAFALVALLGIAMAVGLWYYRGSGLSSAASATPAVRLARVRQGDLRIIVSGAGKLMASEEVGVGFEVSGRVAEILVGVGDRVQKGQVLARLDASDLNRQVEQARIAVRQAELKLAQLQQPPSEEQVKAAQAAVAVAEAAYQQLLAGPSPEKLASAKAALEKARLALQEAQIAYADAATDPSKASAALAAYQKALLDYEVAKANYDATVAPASQSELDNALAQVLTARKKLQDLLSGPSESELEAARLDLEKTQLSLQQAEEALAKAELRSPIDGVVTAVNVSVGQQPSGTAVTIMDPTRFSVRAYVDESDIHLVEVGQQAHVTFDALPDRTFLGRVARIEPGLTEVQGVPVATVWVELDLSEAAAPVSLLQGMNGNVEIIAAERLGALLAPKEAVRELGGGRYAVLVASEGGELTMRQVQIGICDDVYCEVLSGLSAGDSVSTGSVEVGG